MPSEIITDSPDLESWLAPYRGVIGPDFDGYRGHLYRVLNYALWFLGDDPGARRAVEFALVHHDLGLWTDRELAYLDPSIEGALAVNERDGLGFEPSLIRAMIFHHHKITAYRGPHTREVEAFRKADWIDASKGRLRKGIPADFVTRVRGAIPEQGFYETLGRLGPELSGGSRVRMIGKFLGVFKF